MKQFTLLGHTPSSPAPSREIMTVRDSARARELAAKRLRDSPWFDRVEVWDGQVALFNITRADLS